MPLPLGVGLVISAIATQILDGATDIASDIAIDSLSTHLNKITFNGSGLGAYVGNQVKFRASSIANSQIMHHSMKYANKMENKIQKYRDDIEIEVSNRKKGFVNTVKNTATLGKINRDMDSKKGKVYDDASKFYKTALDGQNVAYQRAQGYTQGNRALKNTYDYSQKRVEDLVQISDPNIVRLINALGYLPAKGSTV